MPLPGERTKDLYEDFPGCHKPPVIPLPDPDDEGAMEAAGFDTRSLSFRILRFVLLLGGFRKFQRRLSEGDLEHLLRRNDLRQLEQCSPVLSATVNLADDPRGLSGLERAATLLLGARQLHADVRSGALTPDRYRGQALEMGQYPNLFATSIVWEGKRPRIFKSTETTRVNLAVGGRLFSLPVGEPDAAVSVAAVKEALGALAEGARRSPRRIDEPSLGWLACAGTATQRKAFRRLQKEETNRHTLETLRHGLFTLCLDLDHRPETDAEAARMAHSENFCNRWHHSSLQVVVFGNGKACAMFKYNAYIDGNAMMRGAAEIQRRASQVALPSRAAPSAERLPEATRLHCAIDQALLRKAREEVRSVLDNQQATFEIQNVGRQMFAEGGFDPVPVFILALHLTIVRFVGKPAMIEQQLTLSKFRCMGLTTAVVTTPEMIRFSQYMAEDGKDAEEARTLMREAIDSQRGRCRQARSQLPFAQLLPMFINSRSGRQRIVGALVAATVLLFGIRRAGEVIVSHPAIFPEAPMLGRPGVRLPYLKYFGLHYRMLDESLTITMMPGLDWDIPNVEFIAALEKNLCRLKDLIADEA